MPQAIVHQASGMPQATVCQLHAVLLGMINPLVATGPHMQNLLHGRRSVADAVHVVVNWFAVSVENVQKRLI